MKLKGKSGLSIKTAGIISAVIFVLLLIIRIYQSLALTDGATGFIMGDSFTVPLMYILAIGGTIAVCAMCYVCSVSDTEKKGKSFLSVAGGLVFALTLLYRGLIDLNVIISSGGIAGAKEALGGAVGVLSAFFALAAGIVVIVSEAAGGKNKTLDSILRIPMLLPVLWAFCETLSFFSVTVSYVKVPQLLITIFYTVFLMLFLFENARVFSGIGKSDALWLFYATGIIAAGLGLCSAVPSLATLVVKPENSVSYCPFEAYQLGGAIYALTVIISRITKAKTEKSKEEASVTETL